MKNLMAILIVAVLVVFGVGYFLAPEVLLGPRDPGLIYLPQENTLACLTRSGCGGPPGPPPPPPPPPPSGGEICYATSETGDVACSDGIDNDGDGFCDGNGHNVCSDGSTVGDSDCCPDDFDPCTQAAIIDNVGTCGQLQIPNCKYCQTEIDCFDGNLDTQDFCVSGRCHWESLS